MALDRIELLAEIDRQKTRIAGLEDAIRKCQKERDDAWNRGYAAAKKDAEDLLHRAEAQGTGMGVRRG